MLKYDTMINMQQFQPFIILTSICNTRACIVILDNYRSAVTSIAVSEDGWALLSARIDKIVTFCLFGQKASDVTNNTNDNVKNGEFIKAENIIMNSQKLPGDMHSPRMKFKQHEDSIINLGGSSNHILDKITSSTLQPCHILKHNKQFNSSKV
ncbi:unnamed protein product [Vicia faba]|uniref:Uncharacterized protein n=1 Tax=Vicia faba TaxID=3906 RepID=A0AAV0YP11_VICFA|nr:unnamed protein product [Vicia faba]